MRAKLLTWLPWETPRRFAEYTCWVCLGRSSRCDLGKHTCSLVLPSLAPLAVYFLDTTKCAIFLSYTLPPWHFCLGTSWPWAGFLWNQKSLSPSFFRLCISYLISQMARWLIPDTSIKIGVTNLTTPDRVVQKPLKFFAGRVWNGLKMQVCKALECYKQRFTGTSNGSSEDHKANRNADSKAGAHKVSEGNKDFAGN